MHTLWLPLGTEFQEPLPSQGMPEPEREDEIDPDDELETEEGSRLLELWSTEKTWLWYIAGYLTEACSSIY